MTQPQPKGKPVSPELEAMAKAIVAKMTDIVEERRSPAMPERSFDDLGDEEREMAYALARAALLAIRQPSEAMVFAALDMADTLGPLGPTATWQAMIDHILGAER